LVLESRNASSTLTVVFAVMRRIIFRLAAVLALLIVGLVVALVLSVNGLAKRGIQDYITKMSQVQVKLDGVHLSLLSGAGQINGLEMGNPPGYKTPSSIRVGAATIRLKPTTLFADTVSMQALHIQDPEITVEGTLRGNNLSQILENIDTYTANEKASRRGKE